MSAVLEKKLKILHLSPFYPPLVTGGAELYVYDLAREQVAQGHEVHVATVAREADPAEFREGVLIHPMKYWSGVWLGDPPSKYSRPRRVLASIVRPFSITALLRFDRIVKAVRPDVIHAHTMNGISDSMWLSGRIRGIPIVHTLHDFSQYCARSNVFRDGKICAGRCGNCRMSTESNRLFESCVDSVVGVGRDILARYLAAGRFTRIPTEFREVIGNPIRFADSPKPRRKPTSEDKPFTFGLMSRLVPEKGVYTVLEACTKLPPNLNWQLRLAGSHSGAVELDGWRERLPAGRFVLDEWVDPAAFLPELDVFLAPSIWAEPFGRTAVEAMCFGVPVLCTRVGGLQDIVSDGITGWTIPPGDSDALARKLEQLIIAGRDRLPDELDLFEAIAPYRCAKIAEQLQDLYLRVISRRAGL